MKRRLMQKSVIEYNETPPLVLLVMVCSAVPEELDEPNHLDGEIQHPQSNTHTWTHTHHFFFSAATFHLI